jgi:tRNA pseudouridine13 synthase
LSTLPDWARAHGAPLLIARIRATPADFVVRELLEIECSGDGEHDWLQVEKSGANTHWVAAQLARHAGVAQRDVGYAGLKDRHAVATQWFSVRRPGRAGTDWQSFAADGVRIVERCRHHRKLKQGAHTGNAFRIAVRAEGIGEQESGLAARLHSIGVLGVPNYFGEQRFGHDGGNVGLGRAVLQGRRTSRQQRSIGISALRSLLFNEILDARVRAGSWNEILPGERANLDGSGSIFGVETVSNEIARRCADFDIHPTGTLWGAGAPVGAAAVAELEHAATERHADLAACLVEARVAASSRALRSRVCDLHFSMEPDLLWLEFSLRQGAYATAVLREIVTTAAGPA